jgi:hypothetical protein
VCILDGLIFQLQAKVVQSLHVQIHADEFGISRGLGVRILRWPTYTKRRNLPQCSTGLHNSMSRVLVANQSQWVRLKWVDIYMIIFEQHLLPYPGLPLLMSQYKCASLIAHRYDHQACSLATTPVTLLVFGHIYAPRCSS